MGAPVRSDDASSGLAPDSPMQPTDTTTPHAELPRCRCNDPRPARQQQQMPRYSECSRTKINAWSLRSEVFFRTALFRPYTVPPYITSVLDDAVALADRDPTNSARKH